MRRAGHSLAPKSRCLFLSRSIGTCLAGLLCLPGLRKTEISPDGNLCSDSVTAQGIPNRILTETRNTCEIKSFVLIKNTPPKPAS